MRSIAFSMLGAALAAFLLAGCGAKNSGTPSAAPGPSQASVQKPAPAGAGQGGEPAKPAAQAGDPAAEGSLKTATVLVDGMT